MSSRTARSVDRTVEKMFRQMAHSSKGVADTNNSSSTAALALERMAEIQKRIARGDTDAAQFLAERVIKQAEAEEPSDVRREKLRALKAEKQSNTSLSKPLLMTVAATIALLIGGGAFAFSSIGSGHSVAGTLTYDQKPLAGAEVIFQPKSGGAAPMRSITNDRGMFRVGGLPPGDYSIFLVSADPVKLPKKYLSAESTPFKLRLTHDRRDLRIMAASGKAP